MPAPSYTYTLANGTTADASQVMQDFNDILNGVTDGTKDLTISALTCQGNVTLNGTTNTIGNASSDSLVVTASLGSSIPIGTTFSYDIGSNALGLRDIYLGSADSAARSTKIRGATIASAWTLTLPTGVPSAARYRLESNTSGTTSWQPVRRSSDDFHNISLSAAVAANALTITLKSADGTSFSATNPGDVVFRSATAGTGTAITREITSDLTLTISSGSTLGHASAVAHHIYVYLLDSAGTVELAASSAIFDTGSIQSSTAEGGAGGADSNRVLYSTTTRSNVAFRLIGRIASNQATAGTWATTPSEVALWPFEPLKVVARYATSVATAFGAAAIVPFATKVLDTHNAFASNTFTCPRAAKYRLSVHLAYAGMVYALNEYVQVQFRKNTTAYSTDKNYVHVAASVNQVQQYTDIIDLVAGDTIDVYLTPGTTNNPTLNAVAAENFVCIEEM